MNPTNLSITILQNPTQYLVILQDSPSQGQKGTRFATTTTELNTVHSFIEAAHKGNLAEFLHKEHTTITTKPSSSFQLDKTRNLKYSHELDGFLREAIARFIAKGGIIQRIEKTPKKSRGKNSNVVKMDLDELLSFSTKTGIPA